MNQNYFKHYSYGKIVYDLRKNDPKLFEPWWAFVLCDPGIVDFYSWLCKSWGKPLDRSTAWGSHISWAKGQKPQNENLWGQKYPKIKFYYSNIIRTDNNQHAWLDVWCPELHEIRQELGLPKKLNWNFHITLGRLR